MGRYRRVGSEITKSKRRLIREEGRFSRKKKKLPLYYDISKRY